jgi:hypothetical protein
MLDMVGSTSVQLPRSVAFVLQMTISERDFHMELCDEMVSQALNAS